jgi:hypothetical protein
MTATDKLKYWKDEWTRLFVESGQTREEAERIIHLAEMNGMFDPHKTLFAVQELVQYQPEDLDRLYEGESLAE